MFFALATVLAPLSRAEEELAVGKSGDLSLRAAIQRALEANPGVLAANGRVEAASARAYQAGLLPNPDLELGMEDWPLRESGSFSRSKRTVGFSQVLPFAGKRSLDKQIGSAGTKVSTAELALARAALTREVKIGYFRVLTLERQLQLQEELLKSSEASAAIARKRVENGAAAVPEQLRAEVQEEQTRLTCADTRRDLATARRSFAALLGLGDLGSAKLSDPLAEREVQALLSEPLSEALASNPRLLAAKTSLDRAELAYRRARLEAYPDLKLGIAGGRAGETDKSIGQVTLSVPLPLWDRGTGKRREAKADITVANAELSSVRQQLLRDFSNALQRYRTAGEQVAVYRDRTLPRAREALRLVRKGFEEGKFGLTDLLDTQRTNAEVLVSYQEKLLELNLAQAELEELLARE